jgi:hypothetical protein
VKPEEADGVFNIALFVSTSSLLIPSQDPSEDENAKESPETTDSGENKSRSSNDDLPSLSQLAEQRPPQKRRPRKNYTRILPPFSLSLCQSRQRSKKFASQIVRDEAAKTAKIERRKTREAKANRTGTGRTKKQDALATALQLVNTQLLDGIVIDTGVELPFRSSQ